LYNDIGEVDDNDGGCYDSKLKGLSDKLTLVLSDTRELNRELFYKLVYLI